MILGIDIGGTAVKLGLVDETGRVHARSSASVCFDHYQTPVLKTVIREARKFLQETGAEVRGAGISATGQVDDREGIVIGTNGGILGYEGSRLTQETEEALKIPVTALNDANAALLGECFAGRARGLKDVVMVTLGTGVGGGVLTGGRLLRGKRGIAGELGHFTLYADGMRCTCGRQGCLECYASATSLVRRAFQATGKEMNGREIFEAAEKGSGDVQKVLDAWIGDVAAGVTGLVHIFNPEMVLIGGGVSVQEEQLMVPLRRRVQENVMPRFREGLQVERALLGNDAGMVGAVKFWLDEEAGLHEI